MNEKAASETGRSISLVIPFQQLRSAVYGLATNPESIQERLATAWSLQLKYLLFDQAPDFVQQEFGNLRQEMSRWVSANEECDPRLVASEVEAREWLTKLLYIFDDLTQMLVASRYHTVKAKRLKVRPELSTSEPTIQQKLQLAVHTLVLGIGSIQERFSRAYHSQLDDVEVMQLPAHLQKAFVEIREVGRKTVPKDDLKDFALGQNQARHLASTLFLLAEQLTDLSIVSRYELIQPVLPAEALRYE
jgi:hypothetical protein